MNCSGKNFAALGERLIVGIESSIGESSDQVRFTKSKSGLAVPQLVNGTTVSSLHSLYDPLKEAEKLCEATHCERGMYVFLGLGAAYHVDYLLRRDLITHAIIIEHKRNILDAIFNEIDLSTVLSDNRIMLLLDLSPAQIALILKDSFNPHSDRRCRIFTLAGRLHASDEGYFLCCGDSIERATKEILGDLAAQSAFCLPWLRNILHNLKNNYHAKKDFRLSSRQVIIAAAGPGLEAGIQEIRKKAARSWILAVDTSLGPLLAYGIIPDAVLSIDCQYISTNHFLHKIPTTTTIFLDIASHPAIGAQRQNIYYIGSMHPLVSLLCGEINPFPQFDFSGGNVTYAACELANYLGAETIELYGADYAYSAGKLYASDTYLHAMFSSHAARTQPISSSFADLLFRNRYLKRDFLEDGRITYQTELLEQYRNALHSKLSSYSASVIIYSFSGAIRACAPPSYAAKDRAVYQRSIDTDFFLQKYRSKLQATREICSSLLDGQKAESVEEQAIFRSLFPVFALLLGKNHDIPSSQLVDEAVALVMRELDK